MTEYRVTAPFDFPYFELDVKLTTTKVKKPSGVAFILMELVSRCRDAGALFTDELRRLGVPNELHGLFAHGLFRLCHDKLLIYRNEQVFAAQEFYGCRISEFSFTPLGSTVYKNQRLVTDEYQHKTSRLYFDISKNDFFYKPPKQKTSRPVGCYRNSEFGTVDENAVDYAGLLKRRRKELQVREDEELYSGELADSELCFQKIDDGLELKFNGNSLDVKLPDGRQDFFVSNITPEEFGAVLNSDSAFKLKNGSFAEWDAFPEFGELYAVSLPSKPLSVDNSVMIIKKPKASENGGSKKQKNKNKTAVFSPLREGLTEAIREICPHTRRAFFTDSDIIAEIPAGMLFDVPLLGGKTRINMMFYIKCGDGAKQAVIERLTKLVFDDSYSDENAEILSRLAQVSGDNAIMERYLEKHLNYSAEDIESCAAIANVSCRNGEWKEYCRGVIGKFFDEQCKKLGLENLKAMHNIFLPVKKLFDMTKSEYLRQLLKYLDRDSPELDKERLYGQLEQLDYDAETILPLANVAEDYMKAVLEHKPFGSAQNSLAVKFSAFEKDFIQLCELTNVTDVGGADINYNIEPAKFSELHRSYLRLFDKIKPCRMFAPEEYRVIGEYNKLFESVRDILEIESAVLDDPEQIDEDYIRGLAEKGDYRAAVCDLHLRLQYELQTYFECSDDVFELLSKAQSEELTDDETLSALHGLRKTRNDLLHPNGRTPSLDRGRIADWSRTVFSFVEGLYESES